jgi:hypothetical protein
LKLFDININTQVSDFLFENLSIITDYEIANLKLFKFSGIVNFFKAQEEYEEVKERVCDALVQESDRIEYGDFQTNNNLAEKIIVLLKDRLVNPKVVIEPTCGKGSFIIAALKMFGSVKKIYGVEIYKSYVWEAKFNILNFYINNPSANKVEIEIIHTNVFNFNFKQISQKYEKDEILIVGNPPWVTNSKLGSLDSNNLPVKSNFKKHSGIDAITGKGNFDIGEYIALMMLDCYQNFNGNFAFLVKNSVIKNIIFSQKQRSFRISEIQKFTIDSKKEFNVSVDASLFVCKLNNSPEFFCSEFNFYNNSFCLNEFGWIGDKFVSSIKDYQRVHDLDGICQFEWRQGIKHDCSTIMEMEKDNEYFVNTLNQKLLLEEDLIYGLIKSSDIKDDVITKSRKYTIITQKKVGQDTFYIGEKYPRTYEYLTANKSKFDARKSSIYKDKPFYSIFGIGDYSFKPYKVAISGLYKNYKFSLILPFEGKPLMLDDTCYFLGFDSLEQAAYCMIILNSEISIEFLQAISFNDAKRTFTKEILMRIDLLKLSNLISREYIIEKINSLNNNFGLNIRTDLWNSFIQKIKSTESAQINIF